MDEGKHLAHCLQLPFPFHQSYLLSCIQETFNERINFIMEFVLNYSLLNVL